MDNSTVILESRIEALQKVNAELVAVLKKAEPCLWLMVATLPEGAAYKKDTIKRYHQVLAAIKYAESKP